jgi:hypothetical protein
VSHTAKFAPVIPTSARSKTRRSWRRALDCGEKRGDVGGSLLDRRGNDVHRMLAGELEDVLAEIGLDDFDACGFERRVQLDLLGEHRLPFRNELCIGGCADPCHRRLRLFRCWAEMRVSPGRFEGGNEPFEMSIEIVDRRHADCMRAVA